MAVCLACFSASGAKAELEQLIMQAVNEKRATVGVAVISSDGDTVVVNGDEHYPLMSVMKLHQAMCVADYLQNMGLGTDYEVTIGKSDLPPGTYSPLRDKFPGGGVTLTVGELLEYTLQLSDNNACDLLFKIAGGPGATDKYIRSLGISDFAVAATEADMHRDLSLCHANYSTPLEAARLIDMLFRADTLVGGNMQFVRRTLLGCNTGQQRIPAGIGDNRVKIAHKTGTSDRDSLGRWIGINDVAHVMLPGGRSYSIAVFVKDSYESFADSEQIIARVSAVVYDYFAPAGK